MANTNARSVQYLGDLSGDGTAVTQAGGKVSIYGNTTPITRPTNAAQAAVTSTGIASASDWDCAQLASLKSHVDDINTLLSAVRAAAVATDLIAGS